jgi:hypothetical protein
MVKWAEVAAKPEPVAAQVNPALFNFWECVCEW